MDELRDRSVGALLAAMGERTPAPGGGAAAGVALALGAALAEMAARFAGEEAAAARAAALRDRALDLAQADAAGYGPVLEAMRLPRDAPSREERVQAALSAAADVPLAIAEGAAEAGALARRLAAEGRPALAGDASTGAELAAAAARAAAHLVEINLEGTPGDPRLERARAAAAVASAAD
jgi:formiminotetrahydrofolate cyclodeaminase